MSCPRVLAWSLAASIVPGVAFGHGHYGGGGHHSAHGGLGGGGMGVGGVGYGLFGIPFAIGGGWGWYGSSYGAFAPAIPNFVAQPAPLMMPMFIDQGLMGGPMPRFQAPLRPAIPVRMAKRVDPVKGGQLVTIGDRLFRAGNLKRASERYEQAARSDPDAAAPRVRLAQVEIIRGHYKESADQLRAAVAADPNFLAKAPDIQTIYAEPADFARQISKLESHVLVEPGDRDAWLVLGAQFYLSGQTRRASDVFVRLSDRQPDPALSAFLEASTPAAEAEK